MRKSKTVIIGIDGVPFSLMKKLSSNGVMPNFSELRQEGTFKRMESSIPDISSVSWSSIITGKNPGEHGVFGFTEMVQGTYTLRFPDSRSIMSRPFWQTNGKRSIVINTPFTYPAQEMNGVLVSGFVAPELEKAVYPKKYLPDLKAMDYRIDVDAGKVKHSKDLFFRELNKTLDTRMLLSECLWKKKWDSFMLVFTGSDRLGHFFWDAYEESWHRHHDDFLLFFSKIDRMIGKIKDKIGSRDRLVILSDHGMERIRHTVNLNRVLKEEGMLFVGNKPGSNYKNIQRGTAAFALDPGRIYLNRKGRYPGGSVKEGDEESVLENLVGVFRKLKRDGRRVVKDIHRRDDIYHGDFVRNAPDIVLTPNTGFSLRGSMPGDAREDGLIGKHNPNAFIYSNTGNVPGRPHVEDVVDIIGGPNEGP